MLKNNKRVVLKIEYIITFIAIIASISMIRIDPTPYSTDEMNYKDITKLLSDLKISDRNLIHAFIKINDTYYPSQPIGYPIISIPFYLLFLLENELFSEEPRFYFSSGFYPPENDDRGTFYWLQENGIIKVFSKKNDLIKFGFSGISFVKNREVNIIYEDENIFNDVILIYPKWYEAYFPAKKGWNKLIIDSENCFNISEIKNVDDNRCVSLMILNPKFEFFVAKPYTERTESYSFYGNETFTIMAINPNQFYVKSKINFVAKSTLNSSIILKIENETYNFSITDYPQEIFTEFITLKPNETKIELEIEGCSNCLVILDRINFYLEKDFYDENFSYYKGFFLEETDVNKRWRWATKEAILYIFSDIARKRELELTLFSYFQNQILKIYLNDELIKEEEISPLSKNIKLKLDLKKGKNIIKFSTENCYLPYLVEQTTDHRCLSFGLLKS